jgi:hypothetical protein
VTGTSVQRKYYLSMLSASRGGSVTRRERRSAATAAADCTTMPHRCASVSVRLRAVGAALLSVCLRLLVVRSAHRVVSSDIACARAGPVCACAAVSLVKDCARTR